MAEKLKCRTVEKFLADARKINFSPFTFLFFLFAFCHILSTPVFSMEIQGGIKYDVDSAREYVQDGIPGGVEVNQSYTFHNNNNIQKVISSYNNYGQVVAVTVTYKNELDKAYIYKSGQLAYVDKYDRPITEFPHRGYRYDMQGNLVLTSLTVSPNEMFRFDTDGKLIAHSVFGIIYDENGNEIGHGK